MAIETHVYDGSAYRNLKRWYVNDGTNWRDLKYVYCHDGTGWRLVFRKDWIRIGTLSGIRELKVISGILYAATTGGVFYLDTGNWYQLGARTNCDSLVYYSGSICACFLGSGVYSWDGATWNIIGSTNIYANTLAEVGGILYSKREFGVGYWNGVSWVATNSPYGFSKLRNVNGVLYGVYSIGGVFYYSGGTWAQKGSAGYDSRGYDIMYLNGTIYFPNQFNLKYWDGTDWSVLGSLANVYTAGLYGTDLYVGSGLTGTNGVHYWNGSAYQKMGKLVSATSLAELDGVLYASNSAGVYYWPLELPPNP
jgi:hypothetical protein